MKIIAVYESRISGGTDRLLIYLIKSWPDKNAAWIVLCDSRNSGLPLIRNELRDYAKITLFATGKTVDKAFEFLRSKEQFAFGIARYIRKTLLLCVCLKKYIFFRNFFRKNRPDIVYLHQGGYPGSILEHIAGIATKNLDSRIRVIVSIQSAPAPRHKRLISEIEDKITNYYADYIIFASKYTMEEYLIKTALKKLKMHIVNEGVIANIDGKRFNNHTGLIKIGVIGSYEKRKGHRVLFNAVSILKKRGISGFMIHCYGQSKFGEFQELKNYARQLNISELITWHEHEADFDKLYGFLDIVVQPSIYGESMPMVPIDCAAYYKPVIASRLQGLVEIVEHGLTGYLFDLGDSETLAGYIAELIRNPDKREQMGNAARIKYERCFSASRMAKEYYDIFLRRQNQNKITGLLDDRS